MITRSFLAKYFDALKASSHNEEIYFYEYERSSTNLPFSVHLRMHYDELRVFNAWGNGVRKDDAYGRALMELIERVTFGSFSPLFFKTLFGFSYKKFDLHYISEKYHIPLKHLHPTNSNGVAIHTSFRKAKSAALFELIERHTILHSIAQKYHPNGKVDKTLGNHFSCRFYYWKAPLNTYVVVGAFRKKDGWYFSSSCDLSLKEAIFKAELEINSFLCLEDEEKPQDIEIRKDDIDSFNRYYRYSGDDRIISFLDKTTHKKIPDLSKKDFYFCVIPQPGCFQGLPKLPCVRVINPYVQQLFFDNWHESYLNPLITNTKIPLPDFPHNIA